MEWAEKRAEALRHAQQLRAEQLHSTTPKTASVAWRTPPVHPRTAPTRVLGSSKSDVSLLELSFRSTPTRRGVRPWSAEIKRPAPAADIVSEKALEGELVKTGRMLTGAQRQLVHEREVAAQRLSEAHNEAARAKQMLRDREDRTSKMEAELASMLEQKELALGSERAKLARTLAEQRRALHDELVRVKADAESSLEKQREKHHALEKETQDLHREVDRLREQLSKSQASRFHEDELSRRIAEEREQQRQERVAHLHKMASRRMLMKDLSRGFNSWQLCWEEEKTTARLMRASISRLTRPAMSAAFAEWRLVYEETRRRGSELRLLKKLRAEESHREELESEMRRLEKSVQSQIASAVSNLIRSSRDSYY